MSQRHTLALDNPDFWDQDLLFQEMERVFTICEGCRLCFNLCDVFPELFQVLEDQAGASLSSDQIHHLSQSCTLCDMCYAVTCPYVPPHAFDLDFPALMLRYRAQDFSQKGISWTQAQMKNMDRNGTWGVRLSGLANWASSHKNTPSRWVMEKTAGIDRRAVLPTFVPRTLVDSMQDHPYDRDAEGPASHRKVILYATCLGNYHNIGIGKAMMALLAYQGVEVKVLYPQCCGMPQWEHGDVKEVKKRAQALAQDFMLWAEQGWDIVALMPTCALMIKAYWQLLDPNNSCINFVAQHTFEACEYVMRLHGAGELKTPNVAMGPVAVHLSCHGRAQRMGKKAAEILRLIPQSQVSVIERCSGHGGSWGMSKEHFDQALRIGKPVAKKMAAFKGHILSDCPLAHKHISQGIEELDHSFTLQEMTHPLEFLAHAYQLSL